jgi:anti-sigma B factor antagonist
MFNISTVSPDSGTIVLAVAGEVDMATAPELLAATRAALAEGRRRSVRRLSVDLAGVSFLDSSGAHTLIASREEAGRGGVALAVANPQPQVQRVLQLMGLDDLVDTSGHRPSDAAGGTVQL